MQYRNVKPAEAKKLVEEEGWSYVDVRSAEEFETGHVPGAFNVPLLHRAPSGGMTPNQDFVRVMHANFAPEAKLVVGCAAGMRSLRACEALAGEGFTSLANMQGGFQSARDGSGHILEPGWQAAGYPVSSDSTPDKRYATLQTKK
jgi:rhodanese-related sulfurtransferase